MRRLMVAVLIALLCPLLCGCQDTGEVENQAYVLVLALDRTEDGALALTARVPRIGKGNTKGENGDSNGSAYLTFSVSAESWSRALDALQWATPRRINLSHIEMIVISQRLAAEPSFPTLMNAISETPHLYTNARLVVCRDDAKAFLEAGNTVIGTRLSSEIQAMLSQYASQGFIEDASLAEVWYCANGIYGDPIAIWGYLEEEATGSVPSPTVLESPMNQRFRGASLFQGGRFVKALAVDETRLLNLIRGRTRTLIYAWHDDTVELMPVTPVRKRVIVDGDSVTLSLSMDLRPLDNACNGDRVALAASIKNSIAELIASCQQLGCDPFGFAESASANFATVPDWLAFNWRSHFRRARVSVDLTVSPSTNHE